MASRLEIAVILSTYQRPGHLERSLASLALQRGVEGRYEVVVTDDGSTDRTPDVVRQFARRVDFPVTFTTHEHDGFRLARCRNDGVRVSRAAYLLFSDGDCIFPADFLRQHLAARRAGVARSGDCLHLDADATRRVDHAAIASGAYRAWAAPSERLRLFKRWIKDSFYYASGHRHRPKLTGCNIGVWRSDYERINGFDECFVGWGCEDDDLARRLRESRVRIASILGYTRLYHLWHPTDPSQAATWRSGANVSYLLRGDRPTRCIHGLWKLDDGEALEPTVQSRDGELSARQRRMAV